MITNPSHLAFPASPDHASVTYEMRLVSVADDTQALLVSLGRPAVVADVCTVTLDLSQWVVGEEYRVEVRSTRTSNGVTQTSSWVAASPTGAVTAADPPTNVDLG